jgi:hypothetical protein
MLVAVCGKIQLYFGELNTMKWIKNATTRPAAQYAASTARKLYVLRTILVRYSYHGRQSHTKMWAMTAMMKKTQEPYTVSVCCVQSPLSKNGR